MPHPESAPLAPSADFHPDWSTVSEHIGCPLCRYDLRGLVDPRCPECGYSFTWAGLFEARRTTHPYLFEHHAERNARSFLRTSLATFLPRRFWRSLSAAHSVRPRRLALYWLLTCLPLAAIVAGTIALNTWLFRDRAVLQSRWIQQSYLQDKPGTARYANWQEAIRPYGSFQAFVDHNYPIPSFRLSLGTAWRGYGAVTLAYALWLCWPFATAAALFAYRRSMRHAAIRPSRVLRCTLYSADLLWWPGVVLLTYLAWTWGPFAWKNYAAGQPPFGSWSYAPRWLIPWTIWTWHALVLLATYRLTVAYARYLRFPGAWAAVPLAAIASLLLLWILYLTFADSEGIYFLPIWH